MKMKISDGENNTIDNCESHQNRQYHLDKKHHNPNPNDIFDKLRMKNDNSPINSILMRDNPSPIYLFDNSPPIAIVSNLMEVSCPKIKLFKAIETFSNSLKLLKLNRSIIRESINKI